ncbi:MAG: adenylate/guanylate cyclase domain-containing protein [Gammaproteobacteria bacterium]|nr:adenylate/guanylate cyclase domain-containing protein [Gammaproteobacteria bacterium]
MTPIQRFTWLTRAFALLTVLICCAHISGITTIPVLSRIENIAYDTRLNLTRDDTPDLRIVIVDIDDQSLAKLGRWPWDRRLLARLVDTLHFDYKIKILGFDMLFAEAENPSDIEILEHLAKTTLKNDTLYNESYKKLLPSLQRDNIFGKSLDFKSVILGYYFNHSPDAKYFVSGELPKHLTTTANVDSLNIPFTNAVGYGANLASLQKRASGAGFIDMPMIDADGIMRRLPLIQRYDSKLYEAFSLAMVRTLLEQTEVTLNISAEYGNESVNKGLESIDVGGLRIPVDETGAVFIPFRGNYPSFPYIPAIDVLEKTIDADMLSDAIVLIGTTAPGLLDMRATPVNAVYPGVEIHANMISGILDQTIKHRPAWVQGAQLSAAAFIGLILTTLLSRLSFIKTIVVYGVLLFSFTAAYYLAWTRDNTDIPIVPLISMIVVFFALQNSFGFVAERLTKNKLERLFGQYVPPLVVNEMSKNPENFSLSGEIRQMTVLFCDLRGFTSLSETLDPGVLTPLINQYMTLMTTIIYRHHGTIDKYIGDAVMAFWGAPLLDGNHAQHAVEAAQEMVDALPEIEPVFVHHGLPPPKVGIGINSGSMHVGNMGSEFRISYTVLGDAVNLASRLENLTKRYGVSQIVGENTRNAVNSHLYRELDIVKVIGKSTTVKIYEPIGKLELQTPPTLEELQLYQQGLTLYRQRHWADAKQIFQTLLQVPAAPIIYQLYLGRCLHLLAHPPGEFWEPSISYKDKT